MSRRFWIGETVRCRFVFTDPETGLAVTPGGVVVRAAKPDGSSVTLSAVVTGNAAVVDVATDLPGNWWIRATATTPSPSATEVSFVVLPTQVP